MKGINSQWNHSADMKSHLQAHSHSRRMLADFDGTSTCLDECGRVDLSSILSVLANT